jgi:hypothetical protein
MTEFDFVYLLNELNNTMWTHIMNFTDLFPLIPSILY